MPFHGCAACIGGFALPEQCIPRDDDASDFGARRKKPKVERGQPSCIATITAAATSASGQAGADDDSSGGATRDSPAVEEGSLKAALRLSSLLSASTVPSFDASLLRVLPLQRVEPAFFHLLHLTTLHSRAHFFLSRRALSLALVASIDATRAHTKRHHKGTCKEPSSKAVSSVLTPPGMCVAVTGAL